MTINNQNILEDFYAGNYKEISHICYEADEVTPKDLTNSEVVFALFDDDGNIILTKTSNIPGQITITSAVNGASTIFLQAPDTTFIYGTFRYQINVIDADGYEETVTTGRINIFRSFAHRPRSALAHAYLAGIAAS